MKLRNKKTGKVLKLQIHNIGGKEYNSLAEINEEWEDHEEPKEDYIRVIESFIDYVEEADESFYCDESVKKFVEKLKAWKRLKDKGFRFVEWQQHGITEDGILDGAVYFEDAKNVNRKDLDLLFGGEE